LVPRRLLNLGCGSRYHPEWINIDVTPLGPGVIAHDLSKGIPLDDASCDAVYHSAVLEHIRPVDALGFLRECNRVLKTGGILRVAVPDLERICRLYLQKLEDAANGDESAARDYDWMILEMYDQTAREQSGGEMMAYLRQDPLPNEAFVIERIGEEGRGLLDVLRRTRQAPPSGRRRSGAARFVAANRRRLGEFVRYGLLRALFGQGARRALDVGRFRRGGEVHHWMYDRFSLARLLTAAGLCRPIQQSATSSLIPDWVTFNLDTLADGTVTKPDLFYMEAIKADTRHVR
jgi:predicted SAM-dependent methyltransferase